MTLEETREMVQEIANRYCAYTHDGSSIECVALEQLLAGYPQDQTEEALLECFRAPMLESCLDSNEVPNRVATLGYELLFAAQDRDTPILLRDAIRKAQKGEASQ